MRTIFVALRALIVTVAFVSLWALIALRIRVFDGRWSIGVPAWAERIGFVIIGGGLVLMLWCVAAFVVYGKGTPAPFDAPREFVAVGPYRWVRNPMYIGGFLALAGFGIVELSLSIVIFSALWLALAHAFVLVYEEPTLKERFGSAYEDYRKAVPRWFARKP